MEQRKFFLGCPEEDMDKIIQEAKIIALEQVKEKLAQSFEKIIWEDMEFKIKDGALKDSACIESGRIISNNKRANDADNIINNEKNISKSDKLVENESSMIEENYKIYLFGITNADAAIYITQNNFAGMIDKEMIYSVQHKELVAVVCQVPKEEFNEFKMQELKENQVWREERIEQHKKIISLLAKEYPIIPMRFSSLYKDHDQVKLFMKENYSDLQSLLGKIRGKMEWELKLFLDLDKFKKFLQEDDNCINNLIDVVSLNQAGNGYSPQKKLAYRIESKAVDLAEEIHRRLYHFSKGAVLNKLILTKGHENGKQMILNGAYLVGKTHEEEFLQVVKWMEETEGEKGLIFVISGPRPCNNFCHVSSTAT